MIDEHTPITLETGRPVIPPTVMATAAFMQAKAVLQAVPQQPLEGGSFRFADQDLVRPGGRIVHVIYDSGAVRLECFG